MDKTRLFARLKEWEPELIALRHDLHRHPETSYEEVRTSGIVQEHLRRWGIEATPGLAVTGVVATVKGRLPGNRSIGMRGDMDALNMTEKNTFAHASTIPGKMHGCGHDGHTVMLLAAARYLSENPDFAGTANFIFQPAEEGGAGGKRMIDEGLFERFPCDAVYSLHNKPGTELGRFITRVGPQLACADSWRVTFRGTGGHGGAPHMATDATIPLAQFILALQTIVGRNVAAAQPAVISIGSIHAGTAFNVIPAEIAVEGSTRSYTPEVRDLIERRIREIADGSAAMSNCTAEIDYHRGYPALINTREQTEIAIRAAAAIVGEENVDPDHEPITAADDFAYMLQARPGCNVMLGQGVGPQFKNNHMPDYDFNDDIIPFGAAYWVSLVHQELAPAA